MDEAIGIASEIAKTIANTAKYCVACTVDKDNTPRGRPIYVFSSKNGKKVKGIIDINEILFDTRYKARKVQQLLNNSHINLTFILPPGEYVSFRGIAKKLPMEQGSKYFNKYYDKVWYPEGPNSGIYTVFKIDVTSIDILSPKLLKYFGSNTKFPECLETSLPFVMDKDMETKQWKVCHPKILSKI